MNNPESSDEDSSTKECIGPPETPPSWEWGATDPEVKDFGSEQSSLWVSKFRKETREVKLRVRLGLRERETRFYRCRTGPVEDPEG